MATISRLSSSFFSIRWRFVLIYLLIVALAFGAVAVIVVGMADDYLVTQRVNEKLTEIGSAAVRISPLMRDFNSEGMYNLAIESSKNMGGRFVVIDSSGVVQADSFSKLNGMYFVNREIYDVLSGKKDTSYGFHKIEDVNLKNGYFWSAYYTAAIVAEDNIIGALVYSASIQDVAEQTAKLSNGIVALSVAACLAVILISFFISGYITKPILKLRDVAKNISDGHFDRRVRVSGRNEIAQLGDAFNKMSERLETLDIQRNEFVSNASHELRTPLSSIKILVESLLYEDNPDRILLKEFLGDINNEIERLNDIISDLLAITKLDQSEAVNKEPVSLKKLIEKTAETLMPLAANKKIEMNLNIPDDIVVECDPIKIRQALTNIIDNSIKYTNSGGQISIRLFAEDGLAKIEAQDNGPGIAKEHIPHIFERFYRVDKARSRDTGGTGLGLYISKRIALLHNGDITVSSGEDRGSVFTLILPMNIDETEVAE